MPWFLVTASRIRVCAFDTGRPALRPAPSLLTAFSFAPPLSSTYSAALFTYFAATSGESDFSIIASYGSPSRQPPSHDYTEVGLAGSDGDLPVSAPQVCVHARVIDDAGRPNLAYAAQYTSPAHPPVNASRTPHGLTRITRGRCGSLPRGGLPPPTFCRSPGAPGPCH